MSTTPSHSARRKIGLALAAAYEIGVLARHGLKLELGVPRDTSLSQQAPLRRTPARLRQTLDIWNAT